MLTNVPINRRHKFKCLPFPAIIPICYQNRSTRVQLPETSHRIYPATGLLKRDPVWARWIPIKFRLHFWNCCVSGQLLVKAKSVIISSKRVNTWKIGHGDGTINIPFSVFSFVADLHHHQQPSERPLRKNVKMVQMISKNFSTCRPFLPAWKNRILKKFPDLFSFDHHNKLF